MSKKPLILIPANVIDYSGSPGHVLRDTYVRALVEIAGCLPLMLPSIGKEFRFDDIANDIDGVLLTGSPSHVAPACYGADQGFEDKYLDLARDATTLPLIRRAVELDKPVLAICRGFQEMNVAFGGTLHQKIHEMPGKQDHRVKPGLSVLDGYLHQAHKVIRQNGGLFDRWNLPHEFMVNTVHQQGANKVGDGLHVEAVAEDGIVEAFSMPGKKFILGTQWHPEGDYAINATSKVIFEKFGESVRRK